MLALPFSKCKNWGTGDVNISPTMVLKIPESTLDCKEIKAVNPKGSRQWKYSLEGLTLKLKLQYFGHLMWRARLTGKDPDAGKDWGQEEKRATEDETVGWHHPLNGHEFQETLGDSEGQGSLECRSPWGRKASDNEPQKSSTAGSALPWAGHLF